jgi:hypothetical protein
MRRPGFGVRSVAALAGTALLAFAPLAGPGATAAATRSLTIYALATKVQLTDHSDDRQRGLKSNPFNVDTKTLPPIFKGNGKGSHAGDEALFSFKLYSDPALKKRIGSATYRCTFTFGNQALCQADFELDNGAMFASGPADFQSSSLTLAVSGGSGSYFGARGQVSSAPHAKDAHRLTFLLR